MRGIWAVARQTFAQCLRMKIGGLFIILLFVALLVTPLLSRGGQIPLADRVRTFLSYSVGLVMILTSVVTVFLGAGVVSSDVASKQIFLLAVKPLARWQYIVGRWLGLVMLDAVLLALSGGAIYGIAQHMRAQQAISANDRREIETEIFTSRKQIGPDMEEIHQKVERAIQDKLQQMKDQGTLESAVESFRPISGGNENKARQMLCDEFRKQMWEKHQSVAPGMSLQWMFKGIYVAGSTRVAQGTVRQLDRQQGLVEIQAPRDLLGLLLFGRPVRVAGVDGRVVELAPDTFVVQMPQTELARSALAGLAASQPVEIAMDPVVQVTYKATALKNPDAGPLYGLWFVQTPPPEDPAKAQQPNFVDFIPRSDPPELPATLTISARAVDASGRMQVVYVNSVRPDGFATSVSIPAANISVLYRVGSFESNFAKGVAMMLVQMGFIAAMAVCAGSFLGFSVASLLVFVLLPFGLASSYLNEAVNAMDADALSALCSVVVKSLSILVPNFEALSPTESLVGGLQIPWDTFTSLTPVLTGLLGIAVVLGLACLIWRKRELARVQV